MRRLLILATAALAAACTTPPPATGPAPAAGGVYAPNANLHVEGIPPIPQSLVRSLAPYTDFRGHGFMDWHPSRREMLVTHRPAGASTP